MPLFIDVETLSQDPEEWGQVDPETMEPPGNMKREETIAAWREAQRETAAAEARAATSLDPHLGGVVLVVGIAVNDKPVAILQNITGDEAGELALLQQLERGLMRYPDEPLVAYNGVRFDFGFLGKRALRHGLYSLARRMFLPKPWVTTHLDPFAAWQQGDRSAKGKLVNVARFLGLAIPADDLDGSEVAAAYARGEMDRIVRHCRSDVELLREIYWRMAAAGWLPGEHPDDLPVRPPRVSAKDADLEADFPELAALIDLRAEAARLQLEAAKDDIRRCAEVAGIAWREGVDHGEDGPVIDAEVTDLQLRVFVRELGKLPTSG